MRRMQVGVLATVMVLAACGGGGGTGGSATITIESSAFGEPITVTMGDTVTVENKDSLDHTLTADDGSFDTGTIAGGSSVPLVFNQAGTFPFHCEIHQTTMMGSITVEE